MDKEGPSQLPGITGTRSAMVLPPLALLRQRCSGILLQASWAQETRDLARIACLHESGCWSRPCLSHKPLGDPQADGCDHTLGGGAQRMPEGGGGSRRERLRDVEAGVPERPPFLEARLQAPSPGHGLACVGAGTQEPTRGWSKGTDWALPASQPRTP